MTGEPERNDGSIADEGRVLDERLTPDLRQTLGDLALMSGKHVELSDALAEASRRMSLLVERHPELAGASGELLAKVAQLHDLHGELGQEVMRFSHALEDEMVE